jgi:hypothetical protein
MIATKTTAMVVALAAVAVLGALATVGNQAAFAQVTQTNTNTNTAVAICSPSEAGAGNQGVVCTISQEQGACQLNVGAENNVVSGRDTSIGQELSGSIAESDCS